MATDRDRHDGGPGTDAHLRRMVAVLDELTAAEGIAVSDVDPHAGAQRATLTLAIDTAALDVGQVAAPTATHSDPTSLYPDEAVATQATADDGDEGRADGGGVDERETDAREEPEVPPPPESIAADLSPAKADIAAAVQADGPLTVPEIDERVEWTSADKLTRELHDEGVLARERDDEDRRRFVYWLADADADQADDGDDRTTVTDGSGGTLALPAGTTQADVRAVVDDRQPVAYLGNVADDLGVTTGRCRAILHALDCYSDVRDAPGPISERREQG